ncbi:MAG: ATP-binding protein [Roseburia sp.]|nr:ATP-binding protein [Roseburia sp.]MCM1280205.1 ATP-binding protein [Robinsoniella sp.]
MDVRNYEKILDAMQMTGIYVVREDNHEILYYNKQMKEVSPNTQAGKICHEVWGGSCANCPLLTIGDNDESRSISYDDFFGRVMDIAATRMLWEDRIPAFMITVTPHLEASSYTYHKILKANLNNDSFVFMKKASSIEQNKYEEKRLSQWFEQFAKSGNVYEADIERFLYFTKIDNLKNALQSGKKMLTCTYRRRFNDEFRWNLMEIVPDFDYTDENQSVMIYTKDVHDAYREGLEQEDINIRNQEVIRSLGEQNFGIYTIDLDTGIVNIVRTNDKVQSDISSKFQMWDALMESHVRKELHKAYQDEFMQRFSLDALRKAWNTGEEKIELLCQRQVNGCYRYLSAIAYFNRQKKKKNYAVVALQDTDEQLRREVKHTQNDMRLAALIKSRYSVINTVDLESGQCERVYLNQMNGADSSQSGDYAYHIKDAISTYVHEEDIETFQNFLSLEHLRKKALETEDFIEEVCQYRIKNPIRWIEEHVLYIRQNDTVLVNILGRDFTKEKLREEEAIHAAQEKIYIINSLSSLFFATYYVDLENDTFRAVTQLKKVGKILGDEANYTAGLKTYAETFIHPDDRKEYLELMGYQNLSRTLCKEHPYIAVEYRKIQKGKEGAEECGWIRATAVLAQTNNDGNPKTALYVAQDVTEIKQKEEREQRALKEACDAANHANAAKSEFLSRMSHDIRTPMNGIIGMTTIAGNHLDDKERVLDCLNKITVSGRHLLSLINEVLDMSKIESGKIDLAEESFAISDVIHNLEVMIRPSAQEKGHKLKIHPMEITHENVLGDAMRLQQVFMNILGNSVKYTPSGGILELKVSEKPSKEQGYGCYEFIFQDNGIGMDEEFVKQIFEPFSRAEDSRISKIEGTGLGMTIAQNIVRMMNGRIHVESSPGNGSKFTVTIFLKLQDKASFNAGQRKAVQEAPSEKSFQELSFDNCRILLVEDNEINREIAEEIIGSTGVLVESVTNGREAVEQFLEKEAGYYNLIFMDIQMPIMDGYDATREIRKLPKKDALSIPIIAMSANAFTEDIIASREAGMNEYITKPLDMEQLMSCMEHWLGENRK